MTSHVIEQKSFRVPSRPRALWLSRWPVLLSRLGLGWILGRQFMLISHRGRVSGILRQTGVMILRYDRQTREVYVVAGSKRADWYRNIQASHAVEIEIAGKKHHPVQRFLSTEETAKVLASSRRQHPFTSRVQCLFFDWNWQASSEELFTLAQSLGGVAFRLNA